MKDKRKRYLVYFLIALVFLNATSALAKPPVRNTPPVAVANATPTSGLAPLDVQFTGSGSYDSDGTIVSYYWEFGDGGTSTVADPLYTYQGIGTYTATLTVTDNGDATDTSSPISITVEMQFPETIRFQGTLKDSVGTPITGMVTVTFNLYDVETGGSSLWSEQQTLNLQDGIVDTELGSINPIDLPFDKQYWLGIKIDPDTSELTPRFKLTTVPYAFRAKN